jgi:hypothetical protein
MKIAPDKWRHFYAGILLGAALETGAIWLWQPYLITPSIFVLVIVIVISYGFELFSKITGKGIYDFWDAVASIIGGLAGMLLIIVAYLSFANLLNMMG